MASQLPSWAKSGGSSAPQSKANPNLPSWASSSTPSGIPVVGTKAQPKSSSGGGVFGAIGGVAHVVAHDTELAAHDVKAIPGGFVKLGEDAYKQEKQGFEHPARSQKNGPLTQDVIGMGKASYESVRHPLRDPFQTALTVLPFLTAGAGAVARAGALGKAASEGGSLGDLAKAGLRKPELKPRLISVGDTQVPLHPSRSPLIRLAQKAHDKILQNALDNKPDSKIASYANTRLGGSLNETARYQQRMKATPADLIESRAKQVGVRKGEQIPRKIREAALRLTSENSTATEARRFHESQAAKNIEPAQNLKMAKVYKQIEERGLLTTDKNGHVAVNAEKFPRLAAADSALAKGQSEIDQILRDHGVMSEEGLATRVNAPARIRSGDNGFNGVNAKPGRGYVPYRTIEPKASKSQVASSAGPVVGKANKPINSQSFTGSGLDQGLVPDNTTSLVANHMRDVYRFVNTDQFRRNVLKTGADSRRSSRDVLVRNPDKPAVGKFSQQVEEAIGRKKGTVGTLDEQPPKTFEDHVTEMIPGWKDSFAADKAKAIGTPAPKGFRWVDKNLLGDLSKPTIGPRGAIAKKADALNSAVTAATVYFKIGHVGTRYLTNASTAIIQGSAQPLEIARSLKLWHAIPHEDRLKALAAAGQHGFASLPHEGTGKVAHIATRGANWWARHADAPFRFNSIAYEARKAGFDTPAKFRELLDKLENPHDHNLNAAESAKVDWVAKRANREAIAYDRLSPTERRFLTRAFWFYPWLRGTTKFAANTVLEHPLKSGVGGAAGVIGRKEQQKRLGDVPSYEGGLIPFGSGTHPTVADFSTFSPFSTPADIANAIARPKEISGFLNPVNAAAAHLMFGLNRFDQPTNKPLQDALTELGSTTPEAQIVAAFLNRHKDQSRHMFNTTPQSAFARTLLGPGTPRKVNKAALQSASAREKAGR